MSNMTPPNIEQLNSAEILPVGVTPVAESPVVEVPSNNTSTTVQEEVESVGKPLLDKNEENEVKYLDLGVGFPVIDATDETECNAALKALVGYIKGEKPN